MGREKSEGRVVPEGRRKAVPTAADVSLRGGKATPASEQAGQLQLFSETADSPQEAVAGADTGRPVPAPSAVPKSEATRRGLLPPMTLSVIGPTWLTLDRDSCGWQHRHRATGAILNVGVPKSRMWAHKSGSVRAGGAQAPLATRHELRGGRCCDHDCSTAGGGPVGGEGGWRAEPELLRRGRRAEPELLRRGTNGSQTRAGSSSAQLAEPICGAEGLETAVADSPVELGGWGGRCELHWRGMGVRRLCRVGPYRARSDAGNKQ